jgi:CBS domain-containing protein
LGRRETMQISALMTHEVEIIDPEATLYGAAQWMLACHIRALPVGERDALVGILTDRDLVTRAITAGRDPTTTRVREVMTPDLVTCFADQGDYRGHPTDARAADASTGRAEP